MGIYAQVNLYKINSYKQVNYSWSRVSLLDFSGNFTSQALSILAFVSFLMAGINRHAQNNNLISKLYGETSSNTHKTFSAQDAAVAAPFAKGVFEQQVQEQRELTHGYCVHLFFAILTSCCCCFESCYIKS